MRIALALMLLAAAPAAMAQEPPAPRALPIGTCINMGNSLEPEQEGSWGGEPITAQDFAIIKAAGFDTVRIPVRWHNKSLSQAPYRVDAAWMARVQEVVDQALAADLKVILNSHHFDPIHDDPLGVAEWHGGVWQQIAALFAGYPDDRLWFELENEPHEEFDNENLLETLAPALAAVRATNPTRPVIYGGEFWSGVDSLASLPLPDDANVYPTFHYYEPFDFTHQGAEWTLPDMPAPGRRYGTQADRQRLVADVAKVRAYIERSGKIPFMGETGAYDLHIPTAERAVYHRAVRDAFAPLGVDMCVWAYSNTFPFYDRETGDWLPGLREAIGLREISTQPAQPVDPGPEPSGRRLPGGLDALDEILPGWLVNDPTSLEWGSYGEQMSREAVVDESIPGGGAAIRFTVRSQAQGWSAGTSIPLVADIEKGRVVTAGFWARTADRSPDGRISVRFQRDRDPYPGFGDRTLEIGPEWRFYEVSAVAERDIRRSEAIVALQFGMKRQTLEIGQAIVVVGATAIVE